MVMNMSESGQKTTLKDSENTPGLTEMSTRENGKHASDTDRVKIDSNLETNTSVSIDGAKLKVMASTNGKMAIFTLDNSSTA